MIATRDRRESLLRSLRRLAALPERPPVIVVDNASSDGTPRAVGRLAPWAEVVVMGRNAGPGARNEGARRARTPYVAFSDDDSWWERGALARAAAHLDHNPTTALVAGHVRVGPSGRDDPVSLAMAASPLPGAVPPARRVLGFLACAAIARRTAFLAVGGFDDRLGVGGEEELLAMDLAERGWDLVYLPDVVARHHPPGDGDPAARRRTQARNAVWCAWLRRPAARAAAVTARMAVRGTRDRAVRGGVLDAVREGGWVRGARRVVGPRVESDLRALERTRGDPR